MTAKLSPVLVRGAAAGVIACVVQTTIGKTGETLFLPAWEDSNIAPRLMQRMAEQAGQDLPPASRWMLGTGFHLSYAMTWGMMYAAARERRPVHPLLGGVMLGGLIYGITFPRWGGAVQTHTERPPGQRSTQMTAVAVSVTLSFGMATALVYEKIRNER